MCEASSHVSIVHVLRATHHPLLCVCVWFSGCSLQAVQLALQCLSFDFVGTCLDESSEDLGTIQVPSGGASWLGHEAGSAGTTPATACGMTDP